MRRMSAAASIPFRTALGEWWRVGWLGFGGPAGQIALMHRILVEQRGWLSETAFLRGLNFCMLLPGPEAQQLAIYAGWRLHGLRGGLAAGTLFVLPGALIVYGLTVLYLAHGEHPLALGLWFGLKAAVLALIIEALVRVARRAVKGAYAASLAVAAFIALTLFALPFPAVIGAAALAGILGRRWLTTGPPELTPAQRPSIARTAAVLALGLVIWLAPVFALLSWLGPDHRLSSLAVFFSEMAVVTFGGAYAVLAWVAQAAVTEFGWLRPAEMLTGLGLAESTPGPLILVLEFVGAVAAFRAPAPFEPWTASALGALIVLWVTFVPCFVWILAGAPWVEHLGRLPRAASAPSRISRCGPPGTRCTAWSAG
jgi:chromate transporter